MARPAQSRSKRTARLIEVARAAELPHKVDVAVVGGGAAGLTAAIVAAEAGAQVVVLERGPEAGRSILATGGGRCNLSNTQLRPAAYRHPHFVEQVMGNAPEQYIANFFAESGLALAEEDEGRLYPASFAAASVREVLLARAVRAGVRVGCAREVTRIDQRSTPDLDIRYTEDWEGGAEQLLNAEQLIIAVGGTKAQHIGGLAIPALPMHPVLCPLACSSPWGSLDSLDGKRIRARATLMRREEILHQEAGEILFRPYGISGILAFNLSRLATAGDALVLDCAPTLSEEQAAQLIRAADSLDGLVDPVLASWIAAHTAGDAAERAHALKALTFAVEGTADEAHAQVMRGGYSCEAFDAKELAWQDDPRIHAAGEALDIDGACGGFNLAWAWISGIVAGRGAAKAAHA